MQLNVHRRDDLACDSRFKKKDAIDLGTSADAEFMNVQFRRGFWAGDDAHSKDCKKLLAFCSFIVPSVLDSSRKLLSPKVN